MISEEPSRPIDTAADEALSTSTGSEPDSDRVTSKVIKVKRADFEAAVANGTLRDMDTADAAQQDENADEANLKRALEQLADDITAIGTPAAADNGPVSSPETTGANGFEESDPVTDQQDNGLETEDVTRLMDTFDAKMDAPEASGARDTHDKLRGAAAAAQSTIPGDRTVSERTAEEPYREDLAEIVRPRRPVASAKTADRPTSELRPAPLRLVPEQRVDMDAECIKQGPVRPRRVASRDRADENDDTADSTFAEFASDMNAEALPDLLEAAAAYMVFVEGRAQFSRPQLMNKVRQIDAVAFNREDSLRTFGRLLRDGKIEKTGGGRFTASGEIGFRPDEHVAGSLA